MNASKELHKAKNGHERSPLMQHKCNANATKTHKRRLSFRKLLPLSQQTPNNTHLSTSTLTRRTQPSPTNTHYQASQTLTLAQFRRKGYNILCPIMTFRQIIPYHRYVQNAPEILTSFWGIPIYYSLRSSGFTLSNVGNPVIITDSSPHTHARAHQLTSFPSLPQHPPTDTHHRFQAILHFP